MSSIDNIRVHAEYQAQLLNLARDAIEQYLQSGSYPQINADEWPQKLHRPAGTFVTLEIGGQLRGCIGNIEPQPLLESIAHNAIKAAFYDPRFQPLSSVEFREISISISVLETPQPIQFSSCRELEDLLIPHKDGLILEALGRRGIFLPQVWESLPEPREFIRHLKSKAGLNEAHEPPVLRADRFGVQYF